LWKSLWAEIVAQPDRSFALVLVGQAPKEYNRYLDKCQKLTVSKALEHANSFVGKRVLDLGCGVGRWIELWRTLGADVIGVDVSVPLLTTYCNKSKGGSGTYFAAMAGQDLGFESESFDMVSSITVLQHIPHGEQPRVIREISRCVKPDGWILIHEHIRKQAGSGKLNPTLFPNHPSEWVDMFAKENCELVFTERFPLMPLFLAYWAVQAPTVKLIKAVRKPQFLASSSTESTDLKAEKPSNILAHLHRCINYSIYWLLTWPSWPLEYILFTIPKADRWTRQNVFGAHQTFLFRKAKNGQKSV
jgi:ubiquinone/menaquinone biosynthesis C-methylase UbiE